MCLTSWRDNSLEWRFIGDIPMRVESVNWIILQAGYLLAFVSLALELVKSGKGGEMWRFLIPGPL